jgi:eukaryotic-like serine/threonine-protein kinase
VPTGADRTNRAKAGRELPYHLRCQRPDHLLLATDVERTAADAWTPDGKTLLFTQPWRGKYQIWTLPNPGDDGNKPRRMLETLSNDRYARISTDGRWLAYESDESGNYEVYVRPFPGPGGGVPISSGGGQKPAWSRDGRELFYRDPNKGQLMVAAMRTEPEFRAGRPQALFELHTPYWDVAPDGKRFLVVKNPETPAGGARMQFTENWFEELERRVPRAR